MDAHLLSTGVAAAVLATVHLVARRFEEALSVVPRSRWLSIAGGVSVAYVFVHLLPEIAAEQAELDRGGVLVGRVGDELWLGALAGLVAMYGLDRLAASRARRRSRRGVDGADAATRIHLGAYVLYNAIAGYVLVEQAERGVAGLAAYTVAIAVHFVVNDHGLVADHGEVYRSAGRWLLSAAVVVGWAGASLGGLAEGTVPVLLSVLAGGVVLNVLKEELPEDRRSRFPAFALSAAGYAALLLLA